jgi:type VI secretion system protein ImpA
VERLGESGAPEMEQLIKTATLINRAGRAGDDAQPDETATSSPSQASATTPAAAPVNHTDWRSVQLNSRADAQLMLEKVKLYFAQHEPSHPAPLMIDRVQRLIELDFMAIVRDLAPDGVQQLENIFGRHP